jgi:hypothetical protein
MILSDAAIAPSVPHRERLFLLRIDGVLEDTNKLATHSTNAGWATPNVSDNSRGQ